MVVTKQLFLLEDGCWKRRCMLCHRLKSADFPIVASIVGLSMYSDIGRSFFILIDFFHISFIKICYLDKFLFILNLLIDRF